MSKTTKELIDQSKYIRASKAKCILLIISYVTCALFLGLIIYIIVAYGIDATANTDFEIIADILSMYIGIPMFSITILSAISIGIINLIIGTIDEEDTTKEFKLIGKEETI